MMSQRTGKPNSRFLPRLQRLEDRTTPATFVVSNVNDSGAGSLRQAIINANAAAGHDVILFTASLTKATITLTTYDTAFDGSALFVDSSVEIRGSWQTIRTTLDMRLMHVGLNGTVFLTDLTFRGGTAQGGAGGTNFGDDGGGGGGGSGQGGAILNRGVVTISGCTFLENVASGGRGGNGADLAGTDSGGGGGGGGLGGDGGSTPDIGADGGSGGGGWFGNGAAGAVAVGGGGGGSSSDATGQIGGGAFGGNGGDFLSTGQDGGGGGGGGGGGDEGSGGAGGFGGGGGGGGENDGGSPNGGGAGGWGGGGGGGGEDGAGGDGGIFGGGGGGANVAGFAQSGGLGGPFAGTGGSTTTARGSGGGGGGAGLGGAIFNYQGTVNLLNCTFTQNTARGGLGGQGFGSGTTGSTGTGAGGAFFNYNGVLTGRNVTFTGNTANSGRGVYYLADGVVTSFVRLEDSILGDTFVSATDFEALAINGGVINATGEYNLIRSSIGFTGVNTITVDPQLAPIGFYGGPLLTCPPLAGSPVIDAANPSFSTSGYDQRGYPFTRTFDGNLDGNILRDLGATEFQTSVTVEPIGGVRSLIFADLTVEYVANTVTFRRLGENIVISDPTFVMTSTVGTVTAGGHTVTVPRTLFPDGRIQINCTNGDDTITLDWQAGYVEPSGAGSVFVNAGAGTDTLSILGDSAAYLRVITGLQTPQPTSSSIRRVPPSGTARQHFLTNLENIEVSAVGTLDFLTRNGDDVVNYAPFAGGKGKLSGTSGFNVLSVRQPFIPVTWTNTPTLYIYTSNSDVSSTNNVVSIQPNALKAAGLKNFIYSGGTGVDAVEFKSVADLTLPVGGGQILFNGGAGSRDRLTVTGDANFRLFTTALWDETAGGRARLANVENAVLIGGASANTINAQNFSGHVVIDGKGGNDNLRGSAGRAILIGGIGGDTLTGGANEDILIGGTLTFEANSAEMLRVSDEWLRTLAYASRVAHLKTGGGFNDPTLLTTATAPNDSEEDSLQGANGLDWFWAFVPNDTLLDQTAGELLR